MADLAPGQFFRFAAEHADLLQDLYRATDGVSEADVYACIRKHAGEGAPSSAHVFGRLLELGMLEAAPDATARYELTRPFATLMRFLMRQYQMTSVVVIQSYFQALEQQTEQLDEAQRANQPEIWMRVALELTEHIEEMRHASRNNRNGVIATVMRLKTAHERITPRVRFQEVNRLWRSYIIPLRDMIDSRKVLDESLRRARQVLRGTVEGLGQERREIRLRAEDVLARMTRLRRDVLADFEESIREISPLYEELRRENALARGASAALEAMMQQGFRRQGLARSLGIPNWQMQGQFSDAALESHIMGIAQYEPQEPEPLRFDVDSGAPATMLDMEAFAGAVAAALPIEDAMAWMLAEYPDAPMVLLLRLYGRLHAGRYGVTTFGDDRREYPMKHGRLRACPMGIAAARDE